MHFCSHPGCLFIGKCESDIPIDTVLPIRHAGTIVTLETAQFLYKFQNMQPKFLVGRESLLEWPKKCKQFPCTSYSDVLRMISFPNVCHGKFVSVYFQQVRCLRCVKQHQSTIENALNPQKIFFSLTLWFISLESPSNWQDIPQRSIIAFFCVFCAQQKRWTTKWKSGERAYAEQ